VTVGIDGGGLDDLLGLAVLGREKVTRRWLLWIHAWAHKIALERRKSEAPRLLDFSADGDLTLVDDYPEDIDDVAETVAMVAESGKLAQVGLDPVGIGMIVDALAEKGIAGDQVVGVPQGWRLADAIKTMERKLADGTLVHAGQRLMAWAVGNAKVEPKGNAVAITKAAAGTAKIDPLVASFNAVALMGRNPEAPAPAEIYGDNRPNCSSSDRRPLTRGSHHGFLGASLARHAQKGSPEDWFREFGGSGGPRAASSSTSRRR
jgi:phage terminase large subunit-like protein